MAEPNSTPEQNTWKPLDLSKHWEATPEPQKPPPPTDEQRAQWAAEERQRQEAKKQARQSRLQQSEQRPFMRLQIWRAEWGKAAYPDQSEEIDELIASTTSPVEGAVLQSFQAEEYGEMKPFLGWFLDIHDLAQFKALINRCEHSVVLEATADETWGRPVSTDADYLMTIVDDWVEINN